MPTIHDVRLPEDIERGAKGGPGFLTQIVTMSSGREQRNAEWQVARASYNVGYGVRKIEDVRTILAFFYARKGRAFGFRFKDWADFQVTAEPVGTITGQATKRQLIKTYPDTVSAYVRNIVLPIADTLTVYVDNIATDGYTLGADGVITFPSDPGADVKATFEFDVPCRFDVDNLDVTLQTFMSGEIPSIPIVELK
jgi:uncharacterized protein (TIGR02217 family)